MPAILGPAALGLQVHAAVALWWVGPQHGPQGQLLEVGLQPQIPRQLQPAVGGLQLHPRWLLQLHQQIQPGRPGSQLAGPGLPVGPPGIGPQHQLALAQANVQGQAALPQAGQRRKLQVNSAHRGAGAVGGRWGQTAGAQP